MYIIYIYTKYFCFSKKLNRFIRIRDRVYVCARVCAMCMRLCVCVCVRTYVYVCIYVSVNNEYEHDVIMSFAAHVHVLEHE